MRLGPAAALLLLLPLLSSGAQALTCIADGCADCDIDGTLASCHANVREAGEVADVRCWAGIGSGFAPQPAATEAGAWCATDATGVPDIVGIPGVMVAYEPPLVCGYVFTNYAFGFRLFCVPVA
ncbi:MAG TPA: hypothetical protein VGR28_12300 [Candidatus Thermoplasmatota archaeon]|jgi:hypothetical protein|nr:hypothetical protein [Candidatus Thermoplasmatota archaeon]